MRSKKITGSRDLGGINETTKLVSNLEFVILFKKGNRFVTKCDVKSPKLDRLQDIMLEVQNSNITDKVIVAKIEIIGSDFKIEKIGGFNEPTISKLCAKIISFSPITSVSWDVSGSRNNPMATISTSDGTNHTFHLGRGDDVNDALTELFPK